MFKSLRWDRPAKLTCAPVSGTASSSWYFKLSGVFKWILRVGSFDLLFSLLQILIISSTVLITNGDRSFCFDWQTSSKWFFPTYIAYFTFFKLLFDYPKSSFGILLRGQTHSPDVNHIVFTYSIWVLVDRAVLFLIMLRVATVIAIWWFFLFGLLKFIHLFL